MTTIKGTARVQPSSGNVFSDLGFADSANRLIKAQLARRICQVIEVRGLTQTEAAKVMKLDQPKVSALMRGRLKGFSTERLFRCLNDLGQEVEISIRPSKASRRGSTYIVTNNGGRG